MKSINELKGPEVNPYFTAKVMAEYKSRKSEKQISLWKYLSGFSVTCTLALSLYIYNKSSVAPNYKVAPTHKSMVLQINDIPTDPKIAYVSLEIDEGMQFVGDSLEANNVKEITLALSSVDQKTTKLPFVFKALGSGQKIVKIKFLDLDFNVVATQEHYLEFIENKQQTERKI
jgi:hypothetical protein